MGMDLEGIDIVVLFPTTGLGYIARNDMAPKFRVGCASPPTIRISIRVFRTSPKTCSVTSSARRRPPGDRWRRVEASIFPGACVRQSVFGKPRARLTPGSRHPSLSLVLPIGTSILGCSATAASVAPRRVFGDEPRFGCARARASLNRGFGPNIFPPGDSMIRNRRPCSRVTAAGTAMRLR
jgi:hypothetical protein